MIALMQRAYHAVLTKLEASRQAPRLLKYLSLIDLPQLRELLMEAYAHGADGVEERLEHLILQEVERLRPDSTPDFRRSPSTSLNNNYLNLLSSSAL